MSRNVPTRVLVLTMLMMAAALAGAPVYGQGALAQDAPVEVGADACDVVPGSVAAQPSIGTPPEIDDVKWDYSAGVPADTVLVRTLVDDYLAPFLGCINAGKVASVAALATADYSARLPSSIDSTAEASPLGAGETLTFTSVEAVRVYATDWATVFLTLRDPTYCDSDITLAVVFRQVSGTWLVDDTAEVIGFDHQPWAPPGIRPVDAPQCGELSALAGIRSLRQPRPDGEMATRTAQDVIAKLESEKGRIDLENVRIEGFLDLRGVPSEKIRASNVQFAGGIDASLPIEVAGLESIPRPGMDLYFRDVVFEGPVTFRLDKFKKLECNDCTFEGTLDISSASADDVFFRGTRFEAPALFTYLDVGKTLEVSSSHFEAHADFTGVHFGDVKLNQLTAAQPIQIRWEEFGDRWMDQRMDEAASAPEKDRDDLYNQVELDLRFWQQNFTALGQGRDARQVYRERVELQRDHFLDWTDGEKWEAFYMGAGTAYGTEPYRAVGVVALIVVAFAVLYRVVDPFVPADPAAPDKAIHRWSKSVFAFLFSVDAFVPFAVATGVKDAGWAVRGGWKWAVILERTLGSIATVALAYNVGAYLL
jgi:hypothetical protein